MSDLYRNPMPMGTTVALGQSTQAMQLMASKAYGSAGGRKSAMKRRSSKRSKRVNGTKKRRTKLKFGSPAWRAKYMKRGRKGKRK